MKITLSFLALTLAIALAPTGALAVGINEIGDAGETVGTEQDTTGMGTVDTIAGVLDTDADLYRIYVNDFSVFSADTIGSAFDTQIFLFDGSGNAIASNDDGSGLQSVLPVGDALYSGRASGEYLLGISRFNNEPEDAANLELFADVIAGVNAPTGAGPLDHWQGSASAGGDYVINLTGVGNDGGGGGIIPEPSAALLYLAGFGIVGGHLRRRGRIG